MEGSRLDAVHIDELLERMLEAGCQELHLRGGLTPYATACDAALQDTLSQYGVASPLQIQQMIYALLSNEQIVHLEAAGTLICLYSLRHEARFDVHLVYSKTNMKADFYVLPGCHEVAE